MRRFAMLTLVLSLFAAGAPGAATAATGCAAHTTGLRYRPTITWTCGGTVVSASAVVTRVSTHATVASGTPDGVATSALSLPLSGVLASAATYRVALTYDDGNGQTVLTTSWRTLPPPAHPGLHVKYFTAIPQDAVLDIAHRMDLANLFAVPRASDFVDLTATPARTVAQDTAALRGHQSALVVTGDWTVHGGANLATALARFCNAGHGVVLGGQTHWVPGMREGWQAATAIGSGSSVFAAKWSMYSYDDVSPDQVSGGPRDLSKASIMANFLTKGLTHFTVVGPGSGEPFIQDYFSGRVLATLKKASSSQSPFSTFGQVFLAARQIGAGRLVDLGFRPWSSAIDQGGFDPSQSPGGALTARALWWATNRIPPTDTHFTVTPGHSSDRATVVFSMAAKDQDRQTADDLHFRYRVGRGTWHRAVGDGFVLYHLATGRTYTVYARAFDSGGNVDPHVARYTFRVLPGALG
jgi:hypothetical protein